MDNESRTELKTEQISPSEKKIPFMVKMNYALMMGSVTLMGGIGANLEKFYTDYLYMVPALFGLAHLVFAIVNSINDPIIGFLIDRTHYPKMGKGEKLARITLISIPMFIMGIVFQIVAQPGWSSTILFLCVFLGYSIFDTATATFTISIFSLALNTSDTDSDRGTYAGVQLIFQTLIGIITFVLPGYFLTGGSTYSQLLGMFVGFGIGGLILYIIGAIILQKQNFPVIIENKTRRLLPIIKRVFRQRTYIFYLLIAFFFNALVPNQTLFYIYYMDGYLGMSSSEITIVTALSLPVNILVYAFAGKLIKKLGIRKLLFASAGFMFIGYMFILFPIPNPVGIILVSLSYLGGSIWWVVGFPFFGNEMDEYADTYGECNESSLLGINSIFNAPATSVAIFLFSSIITAFGYQGNPGEQPEHVKLGLRLGIGGLGVFFMVLTIVLIWVMPKLRAEKIKEKKGLLHDNKHNETK